MAKVLLSTANLDLPVAQRSKLSQLYAGPFEVTEVVSRNAIRLKLPPTMKIHPVLNVSRLKLYYDGDKAYPKRKELYSPEPPVFNDKRQELYEVDTILKRRERRSGKNIKVEYLVKWMGYDASENLWVPEWSLKEDVPSLVADFQRRSAASAPTKR